LADVCLGVPGKVLAVDRQDALLMGDVEFGGIVKRVCLEYVPDVAPGEYVLVHVGFALSRIDAAEASRVFALLDKLGQVEQNVGEEP
jgi:hydrogenase expression/formation protein HypC